MDKFDDPAVAAVFNNYPEPFREKLLRLRQLVFDTAAETKDISPVEETLKWGEPSYLTKTGSTIRMDWKQSKPEYYAMYFHCQTKLIETFKEVYGDIFKFEGNRAIVFHRTEKIRVIELKHCIFLSLTYHKRKHLPLLGV